MEMMVGQDQQPQQAAVEKKPLWEDVVDVFVSPFGVFKRQANAGWVKPWLVLSIISVIIYFAFLGPNHEIAVASQREMMARLNRPLPAGAAPGGGTVGQIVSGIFQPLFILLGVLLGALFLWIASAVAGKGPRFKQAMMIMAWASFPTILQKVLAGVLVMLKMNSGEEISPIKDVSTGILRFLDTSSLPLPLVSALAMVDVFAFWQLILWAVALKAVCDYSTGKATAVAVATWLLLLLPLMGMGFLGQMMMG